jgi:hypothetical protein
MLRVGSGPSSPFLCNVSKREAFQASTAYCNSCQSKMACIRLSFFSKGKGGLPPAAHPCNPLLANANQAAVPF